MLGFRSVECPMDLIDQIGGWKSVSSIGNSYGIGYQTKSFTQWLDGIKMEI